MSNRLFIFGEFLNQKFFLISSIILHLKPADSSISITFMPFKMFKFFFFCNGRREFCVEPFWPFLVTLAHIAPKQHRVRCNITSANVIKMVAKRPCVCEVAAYDAAIRDRCAGFITGTQILRINRIKRCFPTVCLSMSTLPYPHSLATSATLPVHSS